MKTSKYLAFGLSALLVLSLASCGGQQTPEPQEPKQEVQQAEPISTQPTMAPVEVKQEVVPVPSETVPEENQTAQDVDVSSEADVPEEIDPAGELFEAVEGGEQTVYVTGTVNIRSIWSIEGEKLGTFNKGQAITRTGTGIEGTEAEGWSQIKVSDGQAEDGTEQFKLVYVSNKYLSTTKPSSGQSGNSSGGQTQTQAPASKPSQGQQQTQQPSGGQQQTQKPEQQPQTSSDGQQYYTDPMEALKALDQRPGGAVSQETDGKGYTEEEMEALGKLLNGG